MSAMIRFPSYPLFLVLERGLTMTLVVGALTVLAIALVRGWRPRFLAGLFFSAVGLFWVNVIIICGWCCEIFYWWICEAI